MMTSISQLSKVELLERAHEYYFSMGLNDGASSLCKWNFRYGLAKLHFALEQLGKPPMATFISTPDETITRNQSRWASGYGYGGKLIWGDKKDPLIFIDTKPNACGMLVGGINELPDPSQILANIHKLNQEETYIDNFQLQWDFYKSNHFIDVFETRVKATEENNYPDYMFVMHSSAPELRDANEKGPGLYYDSSKVLYNMSKQIETPFGPSFYIEGQNAKDYFRFYQYADWFAAEKRKLAAEALFGHFIEICNNSHQGLLSYSEMILGAQSNTTESHNLYPVALRSDLPLYLVRGKPILTSHQIERLGFTKRAEQLDLTHLLKAYNVIPHGGGYQIPHLSRVLKTKIIEGTRFFICEQHTADTPFIMTDPKETQFRYRGKEVINRITELDLADIVMILTPKFVLKI